MKIVHYLMGLPPVRGGGLVNYAIDLAKEQSILGHEVIFIICGSFKGSDISRTSIKKGKPYEGITLYRIENPIYLTNSYGINRPDAFMPEADAGVYRKWLEEISPDIIHIHSLLGIHYEFFQEAKKLEIPIIYTTHDYFGLCPKINFYRKDENCNENDWSKCRECCKNAYSLKKLRFERSKLYELYVKCSPLTNAFHRIMKSAKLENDDRTVFADPRAEDHNTKITPSGYERLRRYYHDIFSCIDFFHFNSEQTKKVFEDHLGSLNGIVYPVMTKNKLTYRSRNTKKGTLEIGFAGNLTKEKGYIYLLSELDELCKNGVDDFRLHVYVNSSHEVRPYQICHDSYRKSETQQVFDGLDLMVVPSLWRETYGFIVAEAVACGLPVLVSDNVGAKDLLINNGLESCVFKPKSGELGERILKIYKDRTILTDINEAMKDMAKEKSYEGYVEEIMETYENLV